MKKIFFSFAALLLSATISARTMQEVVDAFVGYPDCTHATMGVAVADVATGELLASHAYEETVITASTMKTVTSSAALNYLGADFRFKTPVYAVGELKGNKLKGDIVIVGQGDPTLGSHYFPANANIVMQVVQALKQMGIKKIDGKVRIDTTLYKFPPYNGDWAADDLAWDYGMGVHALNYSDNRIMARFTVDNGSVKDAVFTPNVPGLRMVNRLRMGSDDVKPLLEYGTPALVLGGSATNKAYEYRISNPTPHVLLADSLTRTLHANGIKVKGKDNAVSAKFTNDKHTILFHESPTVAEIITSLLERSDNMFAESLLRAIAVNTGMEGNDPNGVQAVKKLWEGNGIATDGLFMFDGSGLARINKATPHFFIDMLTLMSKKQFSGATLAGLMPRVGINARIGSKLPSSQLSGRVAVKSGSMRDVQCYVGYYPADAPKYAFVVLVNNWNCSRATLKDRIDDLLLGLFGDQQ
jgi:D-alanyl-D-alanine carboxypeptidase/D-alanyl-D-alanine-endopeptidase (penicillin-binding protein 4)